MEREASSVHGSVPTEELRANAQLRRLSEIRSELVPRIRRVCPHLPDDIFLELIDDMARLKLRDEDFRW